MAAKDMLRIASLAAAIALGFTLPGKVQLGRAQGFEDLGPPSEAAVALPQAAGQKV
ncbi:hypothetical protein [Cribrihabitans neustonicus]|uniref:hypothetical protein n=1 Tax=Cribrihabitans neustonicus TaxID=1429085 RepID=UPI003B5B1F5F